MNNGRIFRLMLLVGVILPFLFSCSSSTNQKSLIIALEDIDMLIKQKQYKEASKEIDNARHFAYGSWGNLAIYHRYVMVNEQDKAIKYLTKIVKKNPQNLELSAVYTKALIDRSRLKEALVFGKHLRGTKYGSIYSEAVLRDKVLSGTEDLEDLMHEDFMNVYKDAYVGTNNNAWLRNCSLINLYKGDYLKGSEVHPEELHDYNDTYFWALVMYDSRRYGDSINYANEATKFLKDNKSDKYLTELSYVVGLESDAYIKLNDIESSQRVRRDFFTLLRKNDGDYRIPESINDERIAGMFTNSGRWAYDNGQWDDACKTMIFVTNKWPNYVPGLALYSELAYETTYGRKEDEIQLELRDEGIFTLEMERFDKLIKIPFDDAVYKVHKALEVTKEPLLNILNLDLKYKTGDFSEREKCTDLWRVMEESAIAPSVYPDITIDYALSFLLSIGNTDEAWDLYTSHMIYKYGMETQDKFWLFIRRNFEDFTIREKEYTSYFASLKGRGTDARAYYAGVVYEDSKSKHKVVNPLCEDVSVINFALILNSLGEREEALNLYGKIAGRCSSSKMKSLVLYRMGMIYMDTADLKNAKRSLEYAVTLNPHNIQARLALTKLKNMF